MSVSGIAGGIWHSAATALASPRADAPATSVGASAPKTRSHAGRQPDDATQRGLTGIQEAGQASGAFASDIMQALKAYRPARTG